MIPLTAGHEESPACYTLVPDKGDMVGFTTYLLSKWEQFIAAARINVCLLSRCREASFSEKGIVLSKYIEQIVS